MTDRNSTCYISYVAKLPSLKTNKPLHCGFFRAENMPDWSRLLRETHKDCSEWTARLWDKDYPMFDSHPSSSAYREMARFSGLNAETLKRIMFDGYRVRSQKMESALINMAAQCSPIWLCIECGLPMDRIEAAISFGENATTFH